LLYDSIPAAEQEGREASLCPAAAGRKPV